MKKSEYKIATKNPKYFKPMCTSLVLIFIFIMSGCATTYTLDLADRKKIIHSVKLLYTILLAIFFLAPAASAEEHYIRNRFWGGIDAGAGFLQQSFNEEDDDDIYFFLGFQGGYTINPHFLIGLELSGWLLEASDLEDPNKGKGISQVFLITRLYPSKESGLFVKAGGGYVSN